MTPHFEYEKSYWDRGHTVIAGTDEVGRGAFAGPVMVAAVVFSPLVQIDNSLVIRDSKKMTALQREKASVWIIENAMGVGVGQASVNIINKHGISKALDFAFSSAFDALQKSLNSSVDYLLVDGIYPPKIGNIKLDRIKTIVKGDSVSMSIAAASIVAKVARDNLMMELAKSGNNEHYAWHKNKGYGTAAHRKAISNHGTCKHHRKQYVKNWI